MVSTGVFVALCGPWAALWCPKTRLFVHFTEGRQQRAPGAQVRGDQDGDDWRRTAHPEALGRYGDADQRRPAQGRLGDPGARLHRHHCRHLRARLPRRIPWGAGDPERVSAGVMVVSKGGQTASETQERRPRISPKPPLTCCYVPSGWQDLNLRPLDPQETGQCPPWSPPVPRRAYGWGSGGPPNRLHPHLFRPIPSSVHAHLHTQCGLTTNRKEGVGPSAAPFSKSLTDRKVTERSTLATVGGRG